MQENFAKKSNQTFNRIALIITAFSSLLAFLIFKISQNAYLYAGVLIHKLTADCGCTQMTQLIAMHPYIFSALFTLSILILSAFIFSIYRLFRLAVHTRKFSLSHTKITKSKHSSKLKQSISDLHLDQNKIIETRENKPIVFCFGLWIPKVCISTGLIKMLNKDELEAVLLHENSHMIAHEPAKLFIVKFFYSIFFFIPGMKTYAHKFATYSELAADERATVNFTNRPRLARAIMKILDREDQLVMRDGLALSFFTSTIEERVNKLSDNSYTPKFKIWGRGFLFSLSSVAIITLLLIALLSDSTKAFNMHSDGLCEADYSQNKNTAQSCNLNNYQKSCRNNLDAHHQSQSCNLK